MYVSNALVFNFPLLLSIDIAYLHKCLHKNYPCSPMWQASTSDVSVCCNEYQCMPGQSGRHYCVDRHIGKRQEKKSLLISYSTFIVL